MSENCYQRITRLLYGIYSDQKYKKLRLYYYHDYVNCQSD